MICSIRKVCSLTQPMLALGLLTSTLLGGGLAARSQSLAPIADAFVRDGSTYQNSNYGASTSLLTKQSTPNYNRYSYLKFDLASVGGGTITSAKLRLYGRVSSGTSASTPTAVYPVADTAWTESTITWTSKPASAATALDTKMLSNAAAQYYEWDVTAYAQAEKNAGRSLLSLVLKNTATSTPVTVLNAKEAADNAPQLVVVVSSPTGEIELENRDKVPFSNRLVFNRIGSLTSPPSNGVHNVATLRVKNTGGGPLTITGLVITGPWQLASAISLPLAVAPAGFADIPVRFVATSGAGHTGTLTVQSDDADEADTLVQLAGFWQSVSEGGQEPTLFETINAYGYRTLIVGPGQSINNKGQVRAIGDEVISPYWQRADATKPVTIRQLAAFHTQGNTATVRWHARGSNTLTNIFTHAGIDGQSFLPRKNGSTTLPAEGSFSPTGTFGFKIDGEWSDPTKNDHTKDASNGGVEPLGQHVRFWPAKDRSGVPIADAYLMLMDYSGINYDFNDNVYLVTNLKTSRTSLARIDVGTTSSYTAFDGQVWSLDTGLFTPSSAPGESRPLVAIANTVDDTLYQTYRGNVGSVTPRTITFNIPVSSPQKVGVRLHFAEVYWGAPGGGPAGPGKRVFDVSIEGAVALDNFDITTAAGGAAKAVVKSIENVQVNDNSVTITLTADVDYPAISAIEVLSAP